MDIFPKETVEQLDRWIIGQKDAKRAVAIALRNRYRRNQLPKEIRDEITPKNIIMKGPTGVGKTEIARRLAKLVGAPFIKVEATKYTEVGYVGRDVESMIRDLVEVAIRMVKEKKFDEVKKKAEPIVEQRIVKCIVAEKKKRVADVAESVLTEQTLAEYREGKLDNFMIEMEMQRERKPMLDLPVGMGMGIEIGAIFDSVLPPNMVPPQRKKKYFTVENAREQLMNEECERLIDKDAIAGEGIALAEQSGIIFIDEIDKIGSTGSGNGPEVSREGVQRDILPIVEGCTVQTKYGVVKTDYMLFIAAGAFHVSKISDLIPELQGRFPIRVELSSLNKDDFYRILTQPDNAVTKQYQELLAVDNVKLKFEKSALEMMAELAEDENESSENLGARRLHSIMEILLNDVLFNAGSKKTPEEVIVDKAFVEKNMKSLIKKTDLRKYVL
ncbi:MAG: ATP-dependent protease ATPase subunit HslU [Christensenellaceae bacterium]|jgi:ATP-dependent HslUV protease ATP-binding subunit HslU|nr:ATP-dependent protease ATPase subunit HslU [Christensenellaceae bacterium]